MPSKPSRELQTVDNPEHGRSYSVRMVAPEFSCVCPMTGQPDFATIVIDYLPGPRLIELKSLKLYLWSWREEGIFHEAVVNRVLSDLVLAAEPQWMQVSGYFKVRGGITTTVAAATGPRPQTAPQIIEAPAE